MRRSQPAARAQSGERAARIGYGFMNEPLNELPTEAPAQFLADAGTSFAQNLVAILAFAFSAAHFL